MKLVSVAPTEEVLSLTWTLSSRCNYDCMYCPQEFHDNTSAMIDLSMLKTAWHSFFTNTQHKNLPYKLIFTGGEPTVVKAFLPFVNWLRQQPINIKQIVVTTNGSASLSYYLKLSEVVDAISFSTHSEHFDEQKFFNTVLSVNQVMVKPDKSVHVNIMNEYWNQDRIKIYESWCNNNHVSHSVNDIDYSHQTRSIPIIKGVQNLVA